MKPKDCVLICLLIGTLGDGRAARGQALPSNDVPLLAAAGRPAETSPPVPRPALQLAPSNPVRLQPVPPRAVPTPVAAPSPFLSPDTLLEPSSALVWDADAKEVVLKDGETAGQFVFYLTNTSSADILIHSVATSCGCTVAELPEQPWRIAPGGSGPIQVTMNMAGKFGTVTKDVTVISSVGGKVLKVTSVGSDPQSAGALERGDLRRLANMQAAVGNRQAVFRDDCARCHVQPGAGKHGQELYAASCGICHDSPNRASMVADLRNLPFHTDADFWRQWISVGRPNSLMPAFGKQHGGPLDPEQIESLVEHLLMTHPSKVPSVE